MNIVSSKPPQSQAAKPTIVLVALWGVSHFVPVVELGKRLIAVSGGSLAVFVVVVPSPTGKWESEIFERIRREESTIRFHHPPAMEAPTDHTGIEEFVSRYVQLYVPHLKELVSGLSCPVAAVVVDIFCTTLLDAPQELGVPAYMFLISSAAMAAVLLRSPSLDEEVPAEVEFEEMAGSVVDVLPGLPPVPASNLPSGLDNRKILTYKWFLYNGRRYLETNGIIINTIAELEPRILAAITDGKWFHTPPVYTVGPVVAITPPADEKHDCIRWLDAQPKPASVLFLCFGGGGGYFSKAQVREIARGLERSGHCFLWVLRGPPEPGMKLPTNADLAELLPHYEGFLERTKDRGLVWPTRAPQKEILAHASVGGFVTHCGWNSVTESLWFGVPMLPWPHAAEQHFNAFMLLAEMGVAVGMKVDKERNNFVEAAVLERAIKELMGDGEVARKIRIKSLEMKAACRRAVDDGGSSIVSLQRLCAALIQGAVEPIM